MKIAVLDDDISQTGLICKVLSACGHVCHAFQSGKELVRRVSREHYDMLILDWKVPDLSGIDVLHWVREKHSHTIPVMFITSRSNEEDIVEALTAGADSYLIKPITPGELVTRVEALARRMYPVEIEGEQVLFKGYLFDPRTQVLTCDAKVIETTPKEFQLALLFFRHIDLPLSREQILEAVWSRDITIPSRTMDTHISRVRSKLQLIPKNGYRLAPLYRYGYRLAQVCT
ncbi:MAG: response regulator transcription factor [Collimonas sp.]|uniref:response regulator transcription factor n=1 Tax=Collimonas sp. TaxID=1963772 RepID=UPI0032671BE4